ncbi:hypothetical protein DKT69_34400 [Micromonospora sicca]|uniref:Uncharacterized protein n=1 Tax=Micromonospora sicca TaxID=2202420 RepID=A0A317CYE0_9ACTN|nr:hypothetical protein DKT69_34400 [Micromonospora sp. 4G51]
MRFCGYEVDGSGQESFTVGRDHVPIVEVTVAPTPWSAGVPGIGSLSFPQKESYRHRGGHAEDSYSSTESGYASGG